MTEIIEKVMYNGEVTIKFYPNSHQYKKDGQNLLSVSAITGVLDKSAALMYWATNLAKDYLLSLPVEQRTDSEVNRAVLMHKEKKEEAANIGTLAHAWAEEYIKTGNVSLPEDPKVASAVGGFLDWATQHNVQFEQSEFFVYSKKHGYVGTADAIATIDGKRYLIDFKTSNTIYIVPYGMQTAAYCRAYEEETGEKLDGILIVKFAKDEFDKNGNPIQSFELQEIVDIDGFYEAFLGAKVLKECDKKYSKY